MIAADHSLKLAEGKWELTSWCDYHEAHFKLEHDGGVREVVCPVGERDVVQNVLSGHEYPMADPLVELCRGMPVLDIGAHCGAASVYFDVLLEPSRLECYEPDARSFSYLEHNVRADAISRCAVCDHRQGALFAKGRPCASGIMTVNCETEEVIEVPTIEAWYAFDQMAPDGEIGLVKLDAEFAEARILASAEHEVQRARVVYLEYHTDMLRRQCDLLLRDFEMVYCQGRRHQGVACYLNRKFRDDVPGYF